MQTSSTWGGVTPATVMAEEQLSGHWPWVVCRDELTRSQQCPGSKDSQQHPGLQVQEPHNHSPSLASTSSNTQETLIDNQFQKVTTNAVRPGTLAS